MIRDALAQKPGTVQNARGVHPVDGRWGGETRLISKTGATTAADGQAVSWLVGELSVRGRSYVFASAVWKNGDVDGLDGTRLAVRTFIERGLIPR